MPYACTHISKEICVDNYEQGCETKYTCMMDDKCDITGESIQELFENICQHLSFDPDPGIDELFIPNPDEDTISYVGFNRLENGEGDHPTQQEQYRWKKGELTMWLADYSFVISHREVREVTLRELKDSGISTH